MEYRIIHSNLPSCLQCTRSYEKSVRIDVEMIKKIPEIGYRMMNKLLLSRPSKWNTDALEELRKKLRKNDFSEKDLQRGHELVYKKPLADIISMVKHALNF